jgi:hypothetical protein
MALVLASDLARRRRYAPRARSSRPSPSSSSRSSSWSRWRLSVSCARAASDRSPLPFIAPLRPMTHPADLVTRQACRNSAAAAARRRSAATLRQRRTGIDGPPTTSRRVGMRPRHLPASVKDPSPAVAQHEPACCRRSDGLFCMLAGKSLFSVAGVLRRAEAARPLADYERLMRGEGCAMTAMATYRGGWLVRLTIPHPTRPNLLDEPAKDGRTAGACFPPHALDRAQSSATSRWRSKSAHFTAQPSIDPH